MSERQKNPNEIKSIHINTPPNHACGIYCAATWLRRERAGTVGPCTVRAHTMHRALICRTLGIRNAAQAASGGSLFRRAGSGRWRGTLPARSFVVAGCAAGVE